MDGQSNQLFDALDRPAVKFVSATPRSITVEVDRVDVTRNKAIIDFVFNEMGYSKIRLSRLIEKVEANNIAGSQSISRLEFLTMLSEVAAYFDHRILKSEDRRPLGQFFLDNNSISAADLGNIEPLVNAGIIHGSTDGRLNLRQTMTRMEAINVVGRLQPNVNVVIPFTENIPVWAQEGIRNALGAAIVKGYGDGTLRGQKPLTRTEALILLQRLLESYSKPV